MNLLNYAFIPFFSMDDLENSLLEWNIKWIDVITINN